MNRRVLADTNIVLRYIQASSPQHLEVEKAIDRMIASGDVLFVTPQILREFWAVATRPMDKNGFGFAPSQAFESLKLLRLEFSFLDDKEGIFDQWLDLVTTHEVKGVKVHDANHAATALHHGLTHVLTLNPSDFQRYSGSNLQPLTPGEV